MKELMKKNFVVIILVILMMGVIFFYQTQKVGFHEDEAYSIASSVNPYNGLMVAYENHEIPAEGQPTWKSREYVKEYMSLSSENIFNIKSIYTNQIKDCHPPFFYTLVHFSTLLFGGNFTKYAVFIVNIIAFAISCFVLKKIINLLEKKHLIIGALIFYGLSMGTISMVLYQRMYMLLTMFILMYFYYTLRIYKNNFGINKELAIKLGITTVLGFLTQYFFAIFAVVVFMIMLIIMVKNKEYKKIKTYILLHIVYAAFGIALFPRCFSHLLYGNRGVSNLGNTNYFTHLITYLKHLAYSFTLNDNVIVISVVLILLVIGIVFYYKKSNNKFIMSLIIIPSTIFFLVTVQLTSFQELRYIMPIIPFVVLALFLILDELINCKYKNVIIVAISIILVLIGFIFSEPKFLYIKYADVLEVAEDNKDKLFVYVYDNFFTHMKNIQEMMIYKETLILNFNKNELEYLRNDEKLLNEDSFILSIKSYMNNSEVLKEIQDVTGFTKVESLYTGKTGTTLVDSNLYLISK